MSDSVECHTLAYSRDEILGVLRDLEQIVVSLDRIGSATAKSNTTEQNSVLVQFFDDWNVCAKLARARTVLGSAFSETPGTDGMDELERSLVDVPIWSIEAPHP